MEIIIEATHSQIDFVQVGVKSQEIPKLPLQQLILRHLLKADPHILAKEHRSAPNYQNKEAGNASR